MDEPMTDIQTLLQPDPSLLLVDDDKAFLTRLERAMVRRGFDVRTADNVADGLAAVAAWDSPKLVTAKRLLKVLPLMVGDYRRQV